MLKRLRWGEVVDGLVIVGEDMREMCSSCSNDWFSQPLFTCCMISTLQMDIVCQLILL